ncbi:hypothetical protein GQX74_005870 [Glossina fuscipes]|nr:hypothetical protein GQX74_005870 [Glossina fuscipes]
MRKNCMLVHKAINFVVATTATTSSSDSCILHSLLPEAAKAITTSFAESSPAKNSLRDTESLVSSSADFQSSSSSSLAALIFARRSAASFVSPFCQSRKLDLWFPNKVEEYLAVYLEDKKTRLKSS